MNIDYAQIGTRIKQSRGSRKMTQEQLAEGLGVSVGYVSQVERGKTKISLDLLASIATHLNCEIAYLVDGSNTYQDNYLSEDLGCIFSSMSPEKKKMLLKIARILAAE